MTHIKNILVPTDFSEEANNALNVAVGIARSTKATMKLLHIIDVPNAATIGGDSVDILGSGAKTAEDPMLHRAYMDRLMEVTREQFEKLKEKYSDIDLRGKVVFDSFQKQLSDFVVKNETDLIVIGSKGSSGLDEIFVGSNAEKIIRTSKVPVITVKSNIEDFVVKRMVFASDFKNVKQAVTDTLKAYQQLFNAQIDFLKVITPNTFETTPDTYKLIKRYAEQNQFENFTINLHNHYSEEEGIRSFGEEVGADLLAMSTHGRTGLAHLFLGSIAEEVANHSVKPVLTFNQHFK